MDAAHDSSRRTRWLALLGIALFLVAMASFFERFDPYDTTGPNRLEDGTLDTPPAAPWALHGSLARWGPHEGVRASGGVRLDTAPAGGSAVDYAFPAPPPGTLLRLSALVRSEGLVRGERSWSAGRVLLFFSDATGTAHWEFPHEVTHVLGTHDWQRVSKVFTVPPGMTTAYVYAQNQGSAGTFWVDELALVPVRMRSTSVAIATFGSLWFLSLVLGAAVVRLWRRPLGIPIAAVALVVIVGVIAPERRIESVANEAAVIAAETREQVAPPPAATPPPTAAPPAAKPAAPPAAPSVTRLDQHQVSALKKSAHVCLFALLGGLVTSSLTIAARRAGRAAPGRESVAGAAAGAALFAAGTEVLQYLSPTRTPLVADFGLDSLGLLAGALLAFALLRYAFRRREQPLPNPAA